MPLLNKTPPPLKGARGMFLRVTNVVVEKKTVQRQDVVVTLCERTSLLVTLFWNETTFGNGLFGIFRLKPFV